MRKFLIGIIVSLVTFSLASEVSASPRKKRVQQESCFIFCSSGLSLSDHDIGKTSSDLGLRRSKWCSAYVHHVTGNSYRNVADDRAISWKNAGSPASYGCVDCVMVMSHHVGFVVGYDERGNIILKSGNHNRRVGIGTYHKSRAIAFRNI